MVYKSCRRVGERAETLAESRGKRVPDTEGIEAEARQTLLRVHLIIMIRVIPKSEAAGGEAHPDPLRVKGERDS